MSSKVFPLFVSLPADLAIMGSLGLGYVIARRYILLSV
jgi:hypothetical protein